MALSGIIQRLKRMFKKKKKVTVSVPTKKEEREIVKNISMACVRLIIKFEGFSAKPYLCPAGVPTIGYGTTRYSDGTKVTLNDKEIREEEAIEELKYEVNKKSIAILSVLIEYDFLPIGYELDALTSFAYNLGIGPIVNHSSTVNRGIRNNDRNLIIKGMLMYDKAWVKNMFGIRVKKSLRGLTRRREEEVKLFKGLVYGL